MIPVAEPGITPPWECAPREVPLGPLQRAVLLGPLQRLVPLG